MVIGGQHYHRVTAQSGSVELLYEAVVDATRELLGDPSRRQVQFAKSQRISLAFVFAERPMLSGAILGALIGLWQGGLLILLCAATGHWK